MYSGYNINTRLLTIRYDTIRYNFTVEHDRYKLYRLVVGMYTCRHRPSGRVGLVEVAGIFFKVNSQGHTRATVNS